MQVTPVVTCISYARRPATLRARYTNRLKQGTTEMCDTSHCAWLYSHQPLAGRVINISLVAISRHRDVIRYARSQTVELIKLFMINRLPSAIDVRRAESPADQTTSRRRRRCDRGPRRCHAGPVKRRRRRDDRHFAAVARWWCLATGTGHSKTPPRRFY